MTTQPASQIMYAIAQHTGVRNRIEALVRHHCWSNPSEDPCQNIPTSDLAWAVATNETIRAAVIAAVVDGNIGQACEAIDEEDLEYVVLAALARLGVGGVE